MSTNRIEEILREADATAGPPQFGPVNSAIIARRVRRRRVIVIGVPAAAAAVLLIGLAIWRIGPSTLEPQPQEQQQQITSLAKQIEQLQAQTDATLQLVQDVLAREKQDKNLADLEAELASIRDPIEEMKRQADKTAFTLVYQADRLYKELNLTESAVQTYETVIQLYPENRWADVARQRLAEIKPRQFNKHQQQGDKPCEPTKVQSSSYS